MRGFSVGKSEASKRAKTFKLSVKKLFFIYNVGKSFLFVFMNFCFSVFRQDVQSFLKPLKILGSKLRLNFVRRHESVESSIYQCPSLEDCRNSDALPSLEAELLNTSHCQKVQKNWGMLLCRVPHTLTEQLALYEKQGQFGSRQRYTRQSEELVHVAPLKPEKFPFDVLFPPFSRRGIELLERQLEGKLKLQ